MKIVDLKTIPYFVNSAKTIFVSERDVNKFDTSYNVRSPKTGVIKEFNFVHSTGPEFDPKTVWLYKSEDGHHFGVCNDVEITKQHAENYLNHKLGN